jgi:hypothetical protein
MLDIYTSISNQFKPEGDIVDNTIIGFFSRAGYDPELRRFGGGNYPSKRAVIGEPDAVVVHVGETVDQRIGKGSAEELQYAIWEDIPVFLANKNTLFIYKDMIDTREDDWRMYCKLTRVPIQAYQLRECMRAINPEMMLEAIDGLQKPKDKSDNQKGSDRLLL